MTCCGAGLGAVWFWLLGALLIVYAVLDGFDLGVGALHLFIKGDDERRVSLNAVGPVWDGNEVWLITGGIALFGAFPPVYAAVFSGFYIALMLLLLALILRAVSIEFRSKEPMAWWRGLWDVCFAAGSSLAVLLMGVALGNILRGIPLDGHGEFAGTFSGLLHPYPLLAGAALLAFCAAHGGLYLLMKTEGGHRARVRGLTGTALGVFIVLAAILAAATPFALPERAGPGCLRSAAPSLAALIAALAGGMVYHFRKDAARRAFACSSGTIALALALFGAWMYPDLVVSAPAPEHSLGIANAASGDKTLGVMLAVAGIGLPFVAAYTAYAYRVFRGAVKLDDSSY
jgi:cytochrome d ubiquinol oxidase subunit II